MIVVASIATVLSPARGESRPGDSAEFSIVARVPVKCSADLKGASNLPLHAGDNDLGTLNVFCNSPGGYRIILSHSKLPEGTFVVLGGKRTEIVSGAAETVIGGADNAELRHERLQLSLPSQPDHGLALNVYIEPTVI